MMQLTIIGFGNQARAWAKNLRDSKFPFQIALRSGSSSLQEAQREGFSVVEIGGQEFFKGEAFALLTPDHAHAEFMFKHGPSLKKGSLILYAHGFSLMKNKFQESFSELTHILLAPKAIGSELRKQYEIKGKLGAVYSLEFAENNSAQNERWVKDLAEALGINMGPYKTSFKRETEADLYSEQGLLCSLIPYAAREMFTHLIETGTEPELAYFECWHELKLIINAMVDKGPEGFFDLISPNALIGSEKGYQKLFTEDFKLNLRSLLKDIHSGAFNQEVEECDIPTLRTKIRDRWKNDPLEKTFEQINQEGTP